jgi:beta-glucosidase
MYKDKNQPIPQRVEDLLSKMTLDEKLAQISSELPNSLLAGENLDLDKLKLNYSNGLGRITQYSMLGLKSPQDIAKISNEIQHFFVEQTRLGIPVLLQAESLSGYPGADGTMFPSMINAASTFNTELVEEMSDIISKESKAVGIRQALSPLFDIARDPRWGRVYESFGEDPYLVSQMGVAYTKGLQKNKKDGVLATGKHFLGYAETQAGLNTAATRLNDRELYEVFATPFEAGIREADLGSIMTSYSEIDGIPCGANKKVVRELLRKTMGFEGVVVSDGGAVWKLFNTFGIAKDYAEAGLLGIKGGMETEMPIGAAYRQLGKYVESGELDIAIIDEAVRRVLTSKFELGLFDNPYIDETVVASSMTNEDSIKVSKKLTEESIILLKNENAILPLDTTKKIAVVGPHGGLMRPAISGYTAIAYHELIEGMNAGKKEEPTFHGIMDEKKKAESKGEENAYDISSLSASSDAKFDPEVVLKYKYGSSSLVEELASRVQVSYAKGCDIVGNDTIGFANAVEIAKTSDIVIMTLGGNCGWTNCTGGEGKDRTSLDLPGVQQQLLDEIVKTGKDIILVLNGPGQYSPRLAESVKAVINVWLPGAYGGSAIAKVLCGEVNPSGKLPMTMPRNVGQVPIFYNHKTGSGYTVVQEKSGINSIEIFGGGYVDSQSTPLFPFGHGLSYTTFEISNASVEKNEFATDEIITITCTVKNIGDRAGAEVVQLYYRDCEAHVTRPVRQLAGFKKISIKPQESIQLKFMLNTAQLGFYNEDMEFVVEPGNMELMLGTSSQNIVYKETIKLIGEKINLMGKRSYTCPVIVNN